MLNDRIFHKILSVPQNTTMGLNNVIEAFKHTIRKPPDIIIHKPNDNMSNREGEGNMSSFNNQ
jgi:hypothetical protein